MTAKKQRDKNRRRANKLAEQAWEAASDGNYGLAVNIIGRAVDLNPANPVLWNDQGTMLALAQQDELAADSFQAAIYAAPDFAEAFAGLAGVRARQGMLEQAVELQRIAVRHAPASERQRHALSAYEALLASRCGAEVRPVQETKEMVGTAEPAQTDVPLNVDEQNWRAIDETLTRNGVAHVPKLLEAAQCAELRAMFADDQRFAKTVTMNKSHFGKGVYRYFAAPLPCLVESIRSRVYDHVAEIANRWQKLLGEQAQFPPTWAGFRDRCVAQGQSTPSPLLLRYEAGGFNALHQDVRGEVCFPLQLVVVLSERDRDFTGGEFLFCDQPERKRADRRAIAAGCGDAILFCTRQRLMRVGGIYGLKEVEHGLDVVTSGVRFALGIPFHDFA